MKYEPPEFNNVIPNSDNRNSCSPVEFLPGERGIRIHGPKVINLKINSEAKSIVICGEYLLESSQLEEFHNPILIHIYHLDTDKNYNGLIEDFDQGLILPDPFENYIQLNTTVEPTSVQAKGSYFNPNLLTYVDFPLLPGKYKVSVEYGGEKSNEIYFKVNLIR